MTTQPIQSTEDSAPPALYDHCVNTYRAMLREAKSVVTFAEALNSAGAGELAELNISDNQNQIIVYEGFLTQLVTGKLNLSVPYYTHVRKALMEMGCVRQLKRGGGTSPSQWELIYEPTLEAFMSAQSGKKKPPKQTKESMLQEQVNALNSRVSDLEGQVEAVLEALAEQFGTSPKKE